MKDIDTETSVVWPSWCYSDDIRNKLLESKSDIGQDSSGGEAEIYVLPSVTHTTANGKSSAKPASSVASGDHITQIKPTIVEKMLSERSLLLSGYSNNSIDSVKKGCDPSKTPPPISAAQAAALTVTPTTTAAAAAAYLYLEKVKNERMSPRVTAAQIDSLKDAIMESSAAAAAVAAAMANNNNCSSISNNNNSSNSCSSQSNSSLALSQNQIGNSVNNTADDQLHHSHSQLTTATQQQQQQHLHQSSQMHMTSNHVKRERLSPSGTNGDLQSALSRSRSTTPSSFRGTSPQQSVHNSPSEPVVPMHNLSTNLLNSIQQAATASGRHSTINFSSGAVNNPNSGLPSDFSTRNYSDFMRSLAAKYNNTNPNDASSLRRQAFFEANANSTSSSVTKKISNSAQKTLYPSSQSTSTSKEVTITTTSTLPPPPPLTSGIISTDESGLSQTQHSHMAAAANAAVSAVAANAASGGSVSPFMTSFLSSLPFAQGIFPPLIDMSNTQALITLARAAKETEIQNILQAAQNVKRSAACVSPSPSPSLNMALQQAAQFISPALIYSTQLQKQHHASRQSSPRQTHLSNSTPTSSSITNSKNASDKRNASPLDLSSQPPASKRFKPESTSRQSSTDGLHSVAIKRRASSSTATTTPSPPPPSVSEKSTMFVASTAAEATTTATPTPTSVGSSTSATSSTTTSTSGRQCQAHSEEVNSWTVQDVCEFVGSIDICAEYVKHFREQSIDGSGLPLLTEDHLVNSLDMKLGPALKLRSMLAKKLGGPCPCVACVAQAQQMLALQTGGVLSPITATSALNATSIADSASCNSHLPKPNIMSVKNSGTNCNSPSNSSTSSSVNKHDGTTITTTSATSCSASATGTANNNIEGGTPTATGNSNCNINIGHFPPVYGTCNNNNNNSSCSSSINATGNRDDDADSSSIS